MINEIFENSYKFSLRSMREEIRRKINILAGNHILTRVYTVIFFIYFFIFFTSSLNHLELSSIKLSEREIKEILIFFTNSVAIGFPLEARQEPVTPVFTDPCVVKELLKIWEIYMRNDPKF